MKAKSLGHHVLSITARTLFGAKLSMWGDGMVGAHRSALTLVLFFVFVVVVVVLKLLNVFLYGA